jgi:hypothetical protein
MDLIFQHEYYRELLAVHDAARDVEGDAAEAERGEEKVCESSRPATSGHV